MGVTTDFIRSKERLIHVASFLEKGYGWPVGEKERLIELILDNNKEEFPFFGLEAFDENNTSKAAILFIYQGEVKDENTKKKVINVSSWYHEPDYRGKNAYGFTEKMVEMLKDSIITSYTCSKAATKIFRVSGFGGLRVDRHRVFLWKTLLSLFEKCKISKTDDTNSLFGQLSPSRGFDKLRDHTVVNIQLANDSLKVLYTLRKSNNGLFNVLIIHWTDKHDLLKAHLELVTGRLMLRTASLLSETFIHVSHDEENIMAVNWLIYGSKHPVPPIQSEFSSI